MGQELNIRHSTHNCTIYKTTFKQHNILLLDQVDDIIIQTDKEDIAKKHFIIGKKLQLENEDELPFAYLNPTVDFNGVDIEQSMSCVMISCENYIN